MDKKVVMIVEDNREIREAVRILLESEDYEVIEAQNGMEALELITMTVDLIILDIMMPGKSGFSTCEELRKVTKAPVLFLTAKTQDSDKVMGFSVGGDDFLSKPFSYAELLARVKALIRRYYIYKGKEEEKTDDYLQADCLKINKTYNEVYKNGTEVDLTDKEYKVLLLLAENRKKVFSAQSLYETVWQEPYFYVSNGTVMVHIRKLRVKLEDDPQNPKMIKNVWGKGYRFE